MLTRRFSWPDVSCCCPVRGTVIPCGVKSCPAYTRKAGRMDTPEVRWEHYPLVAKNTAARAFIERLVLKDKRPKTVDAYARAVEDLLAYFTTRDSSRALETEEADLDVYIARLKPRGPKRRARGGMTDDDTKGPTLTGRKISA